MVRTTGRYNQVRNVVLLKFQDIIPIPGNIRELGLGLLHSNGIVSLVRIFLLPRDSPYGITSSNPKPALLYVHFSYFLMFLF